MHPENKLESDQPLEAVVGVFETADDASRAAASVRGPDLQVRRVSRNNESMDDEIPEIVYEDIDDIDSQKTTEGVIKGGAIGVGSGLLLMGIPGLNIAAPIAAGLAGAWIGGVVAIDETNRGIELPNRDDYRQMLADGKSFVVVVGSEQQRQRHEQTMLELGALETHQHPPVGQAIRTGQSTKSEPDSAEADRNH